MFRVIAWFRRKRLDRDLDRELRFHLDQHVTDLMAAGISSDEARRQSRLALGGLEQVKERVRGSRSGAWLDRWRSDIRDAWRGLRSTPGVTCTAILLTALVIGGNTTIFSMVYGILTKPARGVQASRLVTIGANVNGRPEPTHSYPEYLDYVTGSTTIHSILGYQSEEVTLTATSGSFAFRGGLVTTNYFDTLGVRLVRGRTFTDDENRLESSGLVAVVSYPVWQDQFHGADDAIGQSVMINGHPAIVIGVAPAGFEGAWLDDKTQVWVPLLAYAQIGRDADALMSLKSRSNRSLLLIGQRVAGVPLSAAQGEFRVISSRLETAYPETDAGRTVVLAPYSVTAGGNSVIAQQGSRFLAILSLITMLTVGIVCANVANLLLARAAIRQRETALRHALGATRSGIVRTLLLEGLMMSFAAWLGSCIFAIWASRLIGGLFPPAAHGGALPLDFTLDWRVIAYAMAVALVATLVFTFPPALRAWRQDVLPWLKAGERGIVQGRTRLATTLVVVQLALAVLLLTSAGFAYRSASLMGKRSPGFETANLVLTTISTSGAAASDELNRALLERLRERLQSVPSVQSVSYARSVPSMPDRRWELERVRGNATAEAEEPLQAWVNIVGPDYLKVLGLSPSAGRELTADNWATGAVAMINQDLADALWPGQTAVGRSLQLGSGQDSIEIVGVTPNALFNGFSREIRPNFVFLSQLHAPAPPGETSYYVRYAGTLEAIAPGIGRAAQDVDPRIPIVFMRTLDTQLHANTYVSRFISLLLALFALASLVIAAIGQYAVIAFDIKRRTRDFGIRRAVGASPQQLVRAAIGDGLRWTAAGLLIGFGLSLGVGQLFRRALFGITPTDATTYIAVFVILAVSSLAACYLPSRRVARIDPMQALRQE
jgi:predicted permease